MRRPICFIGLTFALIILIYLFFNPFPPPSVGELNESTVTLTGRVDKKEYRISNESSNEQEVLVLYLKKVQVLTPHISNSQSQEIEGMICYMEDGTEPKMGSYVHIRGKLREFSQATNPGEFDQTRYYQILNIQARLQKGILLEESIYYDKFREGLYQVREYLSDLIEVCYEKKDASIMKAMLLGEKNGLDEETKQLYQLNGVIHILSISGLHISIIGMGFYKLLHKLRCPKFPNIFFSVIFMYCYGVMTGMSISAVRAIVMFTFHIAAGLFGRTYDMLSAMAVVAVSILAKQPLYLYHSGFLFSFGAILAIGLMMPAVEENLLWETKVEKVMSANISISLVTLPVYLCFYYEYPLYSLLLNLLIIPGTTLIVSDGLASLMAAMSWLPAGKFTAFPAHLLLPVYEFCCTITLRLPKSRNITGAPETWQVIIFLLIICGAVFLNAGWSKLQFWQWLLLALMCITIRFREGLQITVLDVGQGDSIYISDDRGGHYLIDGGSSSKSNVGTYQILPFLKEEGADTLDAVFVTHMDSDHYNGICTLIEETEANGVVIENLILPDIGVKSRNEEYKNMEALAQKQGIRILYVHRGEALRHGKMQFTCLNPAAGEETEDTNAASIVLYLEYENFTALFTGDLEGANEEAVRKQLKETVSAQGITLLKVAHHGSRNSTNEAFLETVSPQIALISAGRDNRYGHPHEELLKRLRQAGCYIYQTKEEGAVMVTYRRGKVRVSGFLE